MADLYENLLKATNNIDDITTEKYGVITKLDGLYCSVKETDNELEHNNVPIVNGANLGLGDKVIIGFLNNSIYDVVCYGALDKTIHDDSKQDLLISGQNIKTINHTSLLGSGNITIQGGSNVDVVTSWEATLSDTKVPSEKLTKNSLDAKADASSLATVATTGDYDDLLDKPNIPSKTSDLINDSNFISTSNTSGLIKNDGTIDTTSYSTFSGSYNDLSNKPSIPTSSSDLSDGSDLIKKSNTTGLLKNDGSVDTTQYLSSLPSHNHDDRYYTETEIDTALNTKQDTLISGTNIKTINNTSLLGSGNISIQGGGSVTVDSALSTTSENPVQNKVITGALNGKADSSSLSTVATSGSYNDLSNKPSIPTKTSDLANDGADGTNVFIANNDSRLSDARTPTIHTHTSNQVSDLIDTIYPIGSIYMSVSNTSPSILFGGTWVQIKDTFLLACGDNYNNGATGGSEDAVVVSHNHNIENDDYYFVGKKRTDGAGTKRVTVPTSGSNYAYVSNGSNSFGNFGATNSRGESGTGKNMPPYLAVYVWKRTA